MGALTQETTTYPFKFLNVQKQFETYRGSLRSIKYYIKVTIDTKLRTHTYEQEFAVINAEKRDCLEEENYPIKLEIGIEDWLQLVFEVDKTKYALGDVVEGTVTFKNVGLKLQTMEVQLMKIETMQNTGFKPDISTITSFELMDGWPTKNEVIPIRFFLRSYSLNPTMSDVYNKFSLKNLYI